MAAGAPAISSGRSAAVAITAAVVASVAASMLSEPLPRPVRHHPFRAGVAAVAAPMVAAVGTAGEDGKARIPHRAAGLRSAPLRDFPLAAPTHAVQPCINQSRIAPFSSRG
jgi:hypothetical protein